MTDKIKIEKGIPIPPKRGGMKYPWNKLEVGDSFIGGKDALTTSLYGKRLGMVFASRKQADGTYRIWRVK